MAKLDTRFTLRDHIRETALFSNRVMTSLVAVFVAVVLLLGRMFYLQIASHEHYTTLSQNNRVTLIPIPPTRGLIYDRNGVVLAQNLPSFTLELTPEKIDNMDETLVRLGKLITLTPDDLVRFQKLRQQTARFRAVPLRYRLNEEEVAAISVRRHKFPGVEIQARLTRHYPLGETAVHALGYVGRISEDEMRELDQATYNGSTHIGKNGVEKSYEEALHGVVGYQKVETNAAGRVVRVLEEQAPVPGKNLYLNLDIEVQTAAEQALEGNRGAIVALDPRTGGVITLVSLPGFDPNAFVNGIDTETYKELSTSKKQPLFNRAIRGRYPPGSTIKPMVGLAGLEYDVIHSASNTFCPGYYQLKNDNHRYRDWRREGHGDMTLLSAIRESCDVFFYDLSLTLGIDRYYSFMSYFGLGKRTGIDIVGESAGLLPNRNWKRQLKNEAWYPGETLITGIGQGYNLTSPLQLAYATTVLANYGQQVVPHIGYALQPANTQTTEIIPTVVSGQVPIEKRTNWEYVISAMERVVDSPRGTAARIGLDATYRIAGKTGTAQIFGLKQGETYNKDLVEAHLRDHALFIGFAPVQAPKIAIAVIVENGGSGGGTAAPVARKVMDAYMLKNPS